MILRLWLRLFVLVLVCIVPLGVLSFWQERESLKLIWQLNPPELVAPLLEHSMQDLRELANRDSANQQKYQERFENVAQTHAELQTLNQVSSNLMQSMQLQVVRNVVLVVLLGLAGSFLIARKVVRDFAELQRKEREAERLQNDLWRLQGWQNIARSVVHELRAPLAPVQVLSESLEAKYRTLPAESFATFLAQCVGTLREQAAGMQRLIENFTEFAKLPEAHLREMDLADFMRRFVESNRLDQADISLQEGETAMTVLGDGSLLQRLFFNLLRNALEANPDQALKVHFALSADCDWVAVRVGNSGRPIPQTEVENLFALKSAGSSGNKLGLGLAICRKIALDHRGDLVLVENSATSGVIFELRIPRKS